MRLEKYLTERTFSINADVDLVYNKIVKPTHRYFLSGEYKTFDKILGRQPNLIGRMTSADLNSKDCKAAHALNSIEIFYANDNQGNYYHPEKGVIHFALNSQQIAMLRDFDYDMDMINREIGSKMKRFRYELGTPSIKGSIYHELSHWLNDTLHNRNITKLLTRAGEHPGHEQEIMKQGHGHINQTFFEIDAQIHSIKQMKRDNKKTWEEVGWKELMTMKSPFSGTIRQSLQNAEYDDYMKHLLKRLNREGLLNKKLQKIPTRDEMWKLVDGV